MIPRSVDNGHRTIELESFVVVNFEDVDFVRLAACIVQLETIWTPPLHIKGHVEDSVAKGCLAGTSRQ